MNPWTEYWYWNVKIIQHTWVFPWKHLQVCLVCLSDVYHHQSSVSARQVPTWLQTLDSLSAGHRSVPIPSPWHQIVVPQKNKCQQPPWFQTCTCCTLSETCPVANHPHHDSITWQQRINILKHNNNQTLKFEADISTLTTQHWPQSVQSLWLASLVCLCLPWPLTPGHDTLNLTSSSMSKTENLCTIWLKFFTWFRG